MLGQRARFTGIIVIVRFTDLIFYYFVLPGFLLLLGAVCLSGTPQSRRFIPFISQTVIYTLGINIQSVVIFSFSGSAAAPARFIFHSMEGNPFRPDKSPPANQAYCRAGKTGRNLYTCLPYKQSVVRMKMITSRQRIQIKSFLKSQSLEHYP